MSVSGTGSSTVDDFLTLSYCHHTPEPNSTTKSTVQVAIVFVDKHDAFLHTMTKFEEKHKDGGMSVLDTRVNLCRPWYRKQQKVRKLCEAVGPKINLDCSLKEPSHRSSSTATETR